MIARILRTLLLSVFLVFSVAPVFSQTIQPPKGKPAVIVSGMDGVIEEYEKDKKVEKYDLQIVLEIKWTDSATYEEYVGNEVHQTIWDLKYEGYGRAVSRLYVVPQFMQSPKIAVAPARFRMQPRSIKAVCYYIGRSGNVKSNSVRQLVSPAESVVAGPGFIQGHAESFTLDFTLSAGVIAPVNWNYPMTMMVPFMTAINPNKIIDSSKMSPQELMADFPAAMEGTFKIPISTDLIDFKALKARKHISIPIKDSRTGPGILGTGGKARGTQRCSYDGRVFMSLETADSMIKVPDKRQRKEAPPEKGKGTKPRPLAVPPSPPAITPPATPPPTTPPQGGGQSGAAGGFVAQTINAKEYADRIVEYYKAGNYSAIYEDMTPEARSSISLSDWMGKCNSQRQRLGVLKRYQNSGEYAGTNQYEPTEVDYYAEFAMADGAITILAIKESGLWKVKAFQVNSAALADQ